MSWGLNPFEERDQPPMSARMFTTLVAVRLRSAGIAVEEQRPLTITVPVDGVSTVVHLDSYYRRYRAEPGTLTPLIKECIEGIVKGESEPEAKDSFERAAPNLLPLLISSAEWEQKQAEGIRMVVRPLVQDLGIALVEDGPDAITYVELERFASWGVDIGSAYEHALDNLERRAQEIPFSQIGEGRETLLIDRAADGYAATRVLVPSRLGEWSSRVPGELVLGMPSRGFLIGFSSEHPKLEALAAQVENDARVNEHGLSPRLLVYRSGELEIYGGNGD